MIPLPSFTEKTNRAGFDGRLWWAALALTLACVQPRAAEPIPALSGAFLQLNRTLAARSTADWRRMLEQMQAIGLRELIVQWTAQAPVVYFRSPSRELPESYDTLERLFAAARDLPFQIYLGLEADPGYWGQLTADERVLRDYFLVCLDRHARLQRGLLAAFGQEPRWAGYYLPEEIDDLTWRQPNKAAPLRYYLKTAVKTLRAADPRRPVAISTFFRGRTEPEVYARTLAELTREASLDYLLVQDGAGAGDLPLRTLPLYYRAVRNALPSSGPRLWLVAEAFRQLPAGDDGAFRARPAPPEEFLTQLGLAQGFERVVAFSFPDYLAPEQSTEARLLYEKLKATAPPARPAP